MFELAKKKKKKIGENFERVRIKKKKRRKEEIKEINETMKKKKNTILRSSTISLCLWRPRIIIIYMCNTFL